MQVQLISQFYFEERAQFKTTSLTSRRDQLVLVAGGSYTYTCEGEEKPTRVSARDIVFLPAGTTLTRTVLEPLTSYHLSFLVPADHPFRLALTPGKLYLPDAQRDAVFNSIQRAMLIPNNQELLEHVVEHVLAEHYMFGKADRVHLRPLSEEVLSTVRYMNQHFNERLDMDALAERVYLSHTGLLWKFRQELNTTPSHYLILLRLRYAKQLLLDHDYTINEIAEMCGYSNAYYFTNAFHRYAGMSPTAFRRRYLEELEEKSPDEVTS